MLTTSQKLLLLWQTVSGLGRPLTTELDLVGRGSTCQSFGVDFKDGGSYFQNISSPDPFTFVSVFQGCQNDTANNLLVKPNGDELICSDTHLLPDGVNMLSTCPILKNQLTSGAWSVLLISNNGNAAPIAYERDFILSVGVPSTYTYTPTITITVTRSSSTTSTSIRTATTTDTSYTTTTTTLPGVTFTPTYITTPTTTTTTTTTRTVTDIGCHVLPTLSWWTSTAVCSVPPRQTTADPLALFTPTLVQAVAMVTGLPDSKRKVKRNLYAILHGLDRRVPVDRGQRIKERKERLASLNPEYSGVLKKRAPDSATVTVTDTNSAGYPISTSVVYNATTTYVVTTTYTPQVTSTRTVTKLGPFSIAPTTTITAPTKTKVSAAGLRVWCLWRDCALENDPTPDDQLTSEAQTTTVRTTTTTTLTRTYWPTLTLTKTATPVALLKLCLQSGGVMV